MIRSSKNKISFISFKDKPTLCFDIRKKGEPIMINPNQLPPLIRIVYNNTFIEELTQQQPTTNNMPTMRSCVQQRTSTNVTPTPNNVVTFEHQEPQFPLMSNISASPTSNRNEELPQTNDFEDVNLHLDSFNQIDLSDDSMNDNFFVDEDDDIFDFHDFHFDDDPNI